MSTFIVHGGCTVHTMEWRFLCNANHSREENRWTDNKHEENGHSKCERNAQHLVKLTSITLLPYTSLPLSGAVGRTNPPPPRHSASLSILPSVSLFRSSNDYLLSSGLMACGLMGPVRMGLVVAKGTDLSDSVRSDGAPWWFEVMLSVGLPASIRDGLLTGALSCCCSEKNLWVDCSTSALCLAWERERERKMNIQSQYRKWSHV